MTMEIPNEDIARLRASPLFDAVWYQARYPDVARLGLDPLKHFARIGACLERDPGPNFSSGFYRDTYPDVAAAGLIPVLHYISSGQAEGRIPHPGALPAPTPGPLARVSHLRALLETGGLDKGPRALLEEVARGDDGPDAAAAAAEALAFYALHRRDISRARHWLQSRIDLGPEARARLAPLQIITAVMSSDITAAKSLAQTSPQTTALHLARGWIETEDTNRLACLNAALSLSNLSRVALSETRAPLIDRLTPTQTTAADDAQPLISVLMAAHNCEATIPTALRAMQSQTWRNFELLVIDDASTDGTARIVTDAAARDPRIRLIPLEQNVGAYGARNTALGQAKGRFVTLHDADDWSHPDRLALQARFLLENPGHVGCISQQARCTDDLRPSRWTGTGEILFENMTSLMLPTDLVRICLGGWDRVRVGADSELLRRVRHLFGDTSVAPLNTGPLGLQRDSSTSATADEATGMGWFYYGARRDYYEAQINHHARTFDLFYPPTGARPFAAPVILQAGPSARDELRLDRVYAGVMTTHDAALDTLFDWLNADHAEGRSAGLVPLYSTAMPFEGGLSLHPRLRDRINGSSVRILCFGERARCVAYRLLPGQPRPEAQRYLPTVMQGTRRVIAPGQAPADAP